MKQLPTLAAGVLLTFAAATAIGGTVVEALLAGYRGAGASAFDATRGKALYNGTFPGEKPSEVRQCTTCHGVDPNKPGLHPRTGKTIAPLSPGANPARLQNPDEVEKWFQRNCTWTLGRPCTPQEKGDFLTYLQGL